jgi:hypothetical protein
MAYVDWRIKGPEIAACNCDWGCPCQFNALPTRGNCRAMIGVRIDEGHFGQVRLDGLSVAAMAAWPGPVHEGHGQVQIIIDERAQPDQRKALESIYKGEETEPMTTFFSVFAAMTEKFHPPMFKRIEIETDLEERTGRLFVEGVLEAAVEPIRNPVTGSPHRAKVVLPHGFEYTEAEFASADWKSRDPIVNDLAKRHAHLTLLHIGTHGVIR